MTIIPLQEGHLVPIEALLDICFGEERKTRTAYAIRKNLKPIAPLSFVMKADEDIIGCILCWEINLVDINNHPIIMLGPIAIDPQYQSNGFGQQLVEKTILETKAHSKYQHMPYMLIGDYEYYGRFGFEIFEEHDWQLPSVYEKHRLLLMNHRHLPLTGVLGPNIGSNATKPPIE